MWAVVMSSNSSLRSSTGICPRTSPQVGQATVTVSPQKPSSARSTVSSPRMYSPIRTLAKRRHVKGFGVSGGLVCVSRIVPPLWLLHLASAFELAAAGTYMPNASWRRAGVARRNGEGYLPPLKRSEAGVERANEVRAAQAKRGSLGTPLARRVGQSP